jgi:hypothetical protein
VTEVSVKLKQKQIKSVSNLAFTIFFFGGNLSIK